MQRGASAGELGKVGVVPVVHPGSLSGGGHYALVTFERDGHDENDRWRLADVKFRSVDV